MNIPHVVLSEAHQTPMGEEEPTLPCSEVSKLWKGAALDLARKLLECARIKQRCYDVLDTRGAALAYSYVSELQTLARMIESLPSLSAEIAAVTRRQVVDRIMALYEEASPLLELTPTI